MIFALLYGFICRCAKRIGYDTKKCYTGRSPLEAASIGVKLKDTDVTFRCNLVTLSDEENYEEEQASLEVTIKELEGKSSIADIQVNNAENFTRLIKDYASIKELDAALLNRLIEKVTVSEPKEINGEKVQEIKIYYKFIGHIQEGRTLRLQEVS